MHCMSQRLTLSHYQLTIDNIIFIMAATGIGNWKMEIRVDYPDAILGVIRNGQYWE